MCVNYNAVIQNAVGIIKLKLLTMPRTMWDGAKESEKGVWSSRCFTVQLLRWQNPEDKHWEGRAPGYKGAGGGEDPWVRGGVRKASQNKQNQSFRWEKWGEKESAEQQEQGSRDDMLTGGPARRPWQEFPGNPKGLDWAQTLGFDDYRNSNNRVQFSSITQSCPNLCYPMDCSLPGFPVHPQLPELAQTLWSLWP